MVSIDLSMFVDGDVIHVRSGDMSWEYIFQRCLVCGDEMMVDHDTTTNHSCAYILPQEVAF